MREMKQVMLHTSRIVAMAILCVFIWPLTGQETAENYTQIWPLAEQLPVLPGYDVLIVNVPIMVTAPHGSTAKLLPNPTREEFEKMWAQANIVDADEPVKVHTAAWQAPPPPNTAACSGVCINYSAQGAEALRSLTGKRIVGVQMVASEVCATRPATLGAGMILSMAGALGYQWHAPSIGTAIVQHTVGLNWRTIIINTIKYGTMFVLDLAIPGAIHMSTTAKTILATVHTAADDLPALFAPGAPDPDPYLKSTLDPNSTLAVGPDHCQIVLFSAVYPGGPKTAGPIQLIP